ATTRVGGPALRLRGHIRPGPRPTPSPYIINLELEPCCEARDARRQNAAVDAGRIEIGRTRRIEQRVRRVRVEDVEYVEAGAELAAADAEILRHFDIEDVERRADLRPVRLDAHRDGTQLIDRPAAVGILRAEQDRALADRALLRLQVRRGAQVPRQAVTDLEVARPAPGFVERVVVILRR